MAEERVYRPMIVPEHLIVSVGEIIGKGADGTPVVIIRLSEDGCAIGLPLPTARRVGKAIYRAAKHYQEQIDEEETNNEG